MAAAAVIALAAIYLTNPQVSPLGGEDSAEMPAAVEDSERENAGGGTGGGRRGRNADGSTTTNDGVAAEDEIAFSSPEEGGAGGDSDTRTGGGEVAGTIAAVGEEGSAPAGGSGNQVAELKADLAGFGVEVAFSRQQR